MMNKEWTAKWIGLQEEDTFNPVFSNPEGNVLYYGVWSL